MPKNTTFYKITGAETFRASSVSLWERWGTNLQNISKSMRQMYTVDSPDKRLVQVDQSGAEALIVSYLCRPGKFRDLFLHGVKPHVFVALHVFADQWKKRSTNPAIVDAAIATEIPELKKLPEWKALDTLIKSSDNWQASERYYYISKMICHASNYGMKAPTFQLNVLEKSGGKIVLSRHQTEQYLGNYHKLFSEIQLWHHDVESQLRATGLLYNLQGFPRRFTRQLKDGDFKEAYAFVPQSTVGCITHIAYTRLQEYIEAEGLKWDLLSNCHDSYLVQCPADEVALCARKMQELMNQELDAPRGERFRMKSEAQSGLNWAPYHENKNPNGLRELAV